MQSVFEHHAECAAAPSPGVATPGAGQTIGWVVDPGVRRPCRALLVRRFNYHKAWGYGVIALLVGLAIVAARANAQSLDFRDSADANRPPDSLDRFLDNLPRMQVDDAKVVAAGIRKLQGKHLTLYTDLPSAPDVDELPAVFDQAFLQWCAYFGVDPVRHADWRMTGFLINDKALFQRTGLLPEDLPTFPHGYARNYEFWLFEQPSPFYRRHLLIHEGTHGFMNTLLGACGPPWYMEGTAELFGTHTWQDGRLTLREVPANKEASPHWGRIKIVRDAMAERRGKRFDDVLGYSWRAHRNTEPYAWCWAAAILLDRHPRYRDRFRQLYRHVLKPDFNDRFVEVFADDLDHLREEWQVFVDDLNYGHDIERNAIDFRPGEPLPPTGRIVSIAADRGWQSSGVQLQADVKYLIRAAGRYQVADRPQIWWCEPGGVSIRYYRGRPLGMLLGAVKPEKPTNSASALLHPVPIGQGIRLTPHHTGTLYLKINDSPAELVDNAGELKVKIERVP